MSDKMQELYKDDGFNPFHEKADLNKMKDQADNPQTRDAAWYRPLGSVTSSRTSPVPRTALLAGGPSVRPRMWTASRKVWSRSIASIAHEEEK